MEALHLVTTWPVEHVTAAVVTADGTIDTIGDTERIVPAGLAHQADDRRGRCWSPSRRASSRSTIRCDSRPARRRRCAICSLTPAGTRSTATEPIAPPERRRIYSNTGIERAADEWPAAAGMAFARLPARSGAGSRSAWRAPTLRGSPAHGARATARRRGAASSPRCCGRGCSPPTTYRDVISTAVPRPGRYRARGGPIRSVPLGTRGRDPRRQVTALDRPRQLAADVRSLRRRRHDDVGRPVDRVPASSPSPTGRSTNGATRRSTLWPQFSDAVVAERRRRRDASRPATGCVGRPPATTGCRLMRYGFVGGVDRQRSRDGDARRRAQRRHGRRPQPARSR